MQALSLESHNLFSNFRVRKKQLTSVSSLRAALWRSNPQLNGRLLRRRFAAPRNDII